MKKQGFTIAEMVISVMLIGIILFIMTKVLYEFGQFNRNMITKQRCISAAQAQLDSISATGRLLESNDIQRLWPDIEVAINKTQGTSQWQSLILIEATATGHIREKSVQVTLSRYFNPDQLGEGL